MANQDAFLQILQSKTGSKGQKGNRVENLSKALDSLACFQYNIDHVNKQFFEVYCTICKENKVIYGITDIKKHLVSLKHKNNIKEDVKNQIDENSKEIIRSSIDSSIKSDDDKSFKSSTDKNLNKSNESFKNNSNSNEIISQTNGETSYLLLSDDESEDEDEESLKEKLNNLRFKLFQVESENKRLKNESLIKQDLLEVNQKTTATLTESRKNDLLDKDSNVLFREICSLEALLVGNQTNIDEKLYKRIENIHCSILSEANELKDKLTTIEIEFEKAKLEKNELLKYNSNLKKDLSSMRTKVDELERDKQELKHDNRRLSKKRSTNGCLSDSMTCKDDINQIKEDYERQRLKINDSFLQLFDFFAEFNQELKKEFDLDSLDSSLKSNIPLEDKFKVLSNELSSLKINLVQKYKNEKKHRELLLKEASKQKNKVTSSEAKKKSLQDKLNSLYDTAKIKIEKIAQEDNEKEQQEQETILSPEEIREFKEKYFLNNKDAFYEKIDPPLDELIITAQVTNNGSKKRGRPSSNTQNNNTNDNSVKKSKLSV